MSPTESGPGKGVRTVPADPPTFRRWMARWATGVSVVTARDGDNDFGLTVNAFLSVSLSPPTILISLTHDADTTPVIEKTGRFALCVLRADQRSISERFAEVVPAKEKFSGLSVDRSDRGLPLIPKALASLECDVSRRIPVEDHVLIVGRVRTLREGPAGPPLLFFGSRYATASDSSTLTLG